MPKTAIEKISTRIRTTRQHLHEYHRKLYKLRRLVAGDVGALTDSGFEPDATDNLKRSAMTEFQNLLVKDVEEGRSNKLLQAIRTLAFQTAYKFPDIEFEDLDPDEAALNAGYLSQILGAPPKGCDAVLHMRRALFDYLIGGSGWVWTGMNKGKPMVRQVDAIQMSWDQTAPSISESRWMSCVVPGVLGDWIDLFGRKPFSEYSEALGDNMDQPLDLEYYYDIEGDGTHAVLIVHGNEELDSKPVFHTKNPCYFEVQGDQIPFLPFECLQFLELPSVGQAIGLTEQMLPSQIALWNVERQIRDTVDMKPGYQMEEGTIDPADYEKWLDSTTGEPLVRKKGAMPVEPMAGGEIQQTALEWQRYHDQELTSHSGADPYASGNKVEGVQYAAEVNAIRSSSGLMGGTIAKDNADFWVRVTRKVLAKGKAYDENPITIMMDDAPVEFGPTFPIAEYLQPFAEIVVQEDSMTFIPRETRIALAEKDLQVASSVALMFPGAMEQAFQGWLKAKGVRNIKKWLQPPAAPMGQAPTVEAAA